MLEPDPGLAPGWQAQDPERARRVLDFGIHSLISAPLQARGTVLGMVDFRRLDQDPFEEEDLAFAEELFPPRGRRDRQPAPRHPRAHHGGHVAAVHDPVSGRCGIARPGHPGPAVAHPDGVVTFPDVPVSPPLGLGSGLPVETAELHLPEGSRLALYTDGLVEDRARDIDTGLAAGPGPGRRMGTVAHCAPLSAMQNWCCTSLDNPRRRRKACCE